MIPSHARIALSSASVLLSCVVVPAQWFARLPPEQLPLTQVRAVGVDAGDIDGDGDLDLVFVNDGGLPLVYRNQGLGRFTDDPTGMIALPSGDYGAVRLCDVDGNGTPDLITGRRSGRLILLRNQGGTFVDASATAFPAFNLVDFPRSIVAFDCDGDADLDLFLPISPQGLLFLNDGTGVFSLATNRLPVLNVAMGEAIASDVSGDGAPDLLITRGGTTNDAHLLLVNDGTGRFSVSPTLRFPAFGTNNGPGGSSLAAGDLDGDGDVDVIAATGFDRVTVYRQTAGTLTIAATLPFSVAQAPLYEQATLLRLGDADGDGDLDLVFATADQGRLLYLNDGTGTFAPSPWQDWPQTRVSVRDHFFVDLDADGDLDLVQATPSTSGPRPVEANSVLFNDGLGNFTDVGRTPLPPTSDKTSAVLTADLDGDGLDDVVHGVEIGTLSNPFGRVFVHLGIGDGTLRLLQRVAFDQALGWATALAAADVDGDGDTDVYAGLSSGAGLLLLNDGSGRLAAGGSLPTSTARAAAATFADFDGDGDPDLLTTRVSGSVFGPMAEQTLLWRNEGQGTFVDVTATSLPAQVDRATQLAVFDLQNDGDLDVFIGNYNSNSPWTNRLLVNDGNGVFTDESALRLANFANDEVRGVAAADFDGNGATDIAYADGDDLFVLLDQGSGFFVDASAIWSDRSFTDHTRLAAWDVDGDGRVDLVNTASDPVVLRNLPAGRFEVQPNSAPPVTPTQFNLWHPAVGDFDADGQPDLLHASDYHYTVHWNLRHRISLPLLPKPGSTFPMRIHADPGHNAAPRPAFFAATPGGRLRSPTPFGTLWLDPAQPITIRAAMLPAPAGIAEVPLELAPEPSLQGMQFTVQGLVLTPDLAWAEFTNPLTATIR